MAEKENIQLAEQMIAAVNARDLNRYIQPSGIISDSPM
jgi:hypothetical protein